MGIFLDNLDFLPGTITEIESDYSLGYSMGDFGTTEEVLLFGTAFNGPVGRPVPVYNPEHGAYIFGKSYNPETRQKATLAPAIKDAYDRGCRNIYAVRISGKQIEKEFSLAADTNLKLRVSSVHPSNGAKDCYFRFDDSMPGNRIMTIYKPSRFATIAEKNQGLVEDMNSQMPIVIDIEQSYGLTESSKIVDFIDLVNRHGRNNVIRLSIVDEYGSDVTNASEEVHSLSLGDVLPGTYFIGREKSSKIERGLDIKYKIDKDNKTVKKVLKGNDNVDTDYPISDEAITTTNINSALRNAYRMSERFIKNDTDYEEVDLSPFEVYKALGSGFATTASLRVEEDSKTGKKTYKAVRTPDEDEQKVVPLSDGIYATMENMGASSRVLTCGSADERVRGLLPKPEDFEVLTLDKKVALKGNVSIESVSKKAITIEIVNKDKHPVGSEDVKTDKVYNVYDKAPKELKEKDIFAELEDTKLVMKKVTKVDKDSKEITVENYKGTGLDGKLILGAYEEKVYIYRFTEADSTITPVCDYNGYAKQMPVLASIQPTIANEEMKMVIDVVGASMITLVELVEYATTNTAIQNYVNMSLTEVGLNNEEEYVDEIINEKEVVETDRAEKVIDENLKIPYTTTDNFARQLAQHCTYTSLKTAPTKGFIGMSVSNSVGLNDVARKVDNALNADFDLYAKRDNGRNMLDRNNLPYHIGRNISIPLMQYPVRLDSGNVEISNGAAGYAGSVSALPLDQSSTNKSYNIGSDMLNLSNYQLTRLTQRGYVTCKNSYTKGIVVTDGITMAPNDSAYKRLSTIRTIGAIDEIIREATEPYIGKHNNLANRNALSTAIKSKLNTVVDVLIQNYDFDVLYDPRTAKFGNIDIDYSIIPTYEIVRIKNRISITDTI